MAGDDIENVGPNLIEPISKVQGIKRKIRALNRSTKSVTTALKEDIQEVRDGDAEMKLRMMTFIRNSKYDVEKLNGKLLELHYELELERDLDPEEENSVTEIIQNQRELAKLTANLEFEYEKAKMELNGDASSNSSNDSVTVEMLKRIMADQEKKTKALIESINRQKISIPKFGGQPEEEIEQWLEIIQANIGDFKSNAEKTIFIKSKLEGEASRTIGILQDPSPEDIMNELEDKYGDKMNKVTQALDIFSEMEEAEDTSLSELERIYTKFASAWNYLTKKCDDERNFIESSWTLTAFARKKLPELLIMQFDKNRVREERDGKRTITNLPLTFPEFLQQLKDAVTIARRSPSLNCRKEESQDDNKKQIRYDKKITGQLLTISKGSLTLKKMKKKCYFCSTIGHYTYKCLRAYELPAKERRKIVTTNNLCKICLDSRHETKECLRKLKCAYCKENHNTLIPIYCK